MKISSKWVAMLVAVATSWAGTAYAQSVEEFYKGKQLHLLISEAPGGGHDTNARLIGKYLSKYIPGNPAIIAENMPGAGQRLVADYLYNQAPQDGTYIAQLHQNTPMYQVVEGSLNVESDKFHWLGSVGPTLGVVVVRADTGITTLDQAKQTAARMGSTAAGSSGDVSLVLLNELFGTKFEMIRGYGGSPALDLAIEQKEIDGRYHNWSTVLASRPEWLSDKLVNVLASYGGKIADMPDVPEVTELAANEDDRLLIELLTAGTRLGRPFATAPNVPEDRVEALRAAFASVAADPEYIAEAAAAKFELAPMTGEEVQAVVQGIIDTKPELIAKAKALLDE